MNLVAKEYVASQDPDDPGVLVLSRFAGAADELGEALLVNPYDLDGVADAIANAATMSRDKRIERWQAHDRTAAPQRHQRLAAALSGGAGSGLSGRLSVVDRARPAWPCARCGGRGDARRPGRVGDGAQAAAVDAFRQHPCRHQPLPRQRTGPPASARPGGGERRFGHR
jgi:hypothetical protein